MTTASALLIDLFVIFLAARVAGEVFERLGQPAVLGELLAGVLIGPHALGLVGVPNAALLEAFHGDPSAATEGLNLVYHVLAELGVVVLLFFVGLETRVRDILAVGPRALAVALLGVAVPFGLGVVLAGPVLGQPTTEALFLGVALVATSVGITARVLRDLGVIARRESRIILGAAVIDDVVGMVLLAIMAAIATTGSVSGGSIAIIAGQAVAFTLFVALVGAGAMRRFGLGLSRLRGENPALTTALLAMLGLAALSASIGLAAIIGAFLAGMVFAETREHFELEHQSLPIYQFLVPYFFVITGTQVDPRLLLDPVLMGVALLVTLVALVGKLAGGAVGMLGLGRRSMLIVGVGMAPRGEVGLIVASLGRSLGAMPESVFDVVVVMSVLTTLVAPPLLRSLYQGDPETAISSEDLASPSGQLPEM